ncbi:MAG: hypothetical protein HKN68_01720 [Saprospiraceae bacterium]|nr:hypothetical protein [Saprospiraceae bacterium]
MLENQEIENDSWQLDFEWLRIRHLVKESLASKDLPDLKVILFLIGVQELGIFESGKKFSKEEKQDLMHVAVCSLLEDEGYYKFKGRDQDGWPHWEVEKPFSVKGVKEQENILKKKIIKYFDQ